MLVCPKTADTVFQPAQLSYSSVASFLDAISRRSRCSLLLLLLLLLLDSLAHVSVCLRGAAPASSLTALTCRIHRPLAGDDLPSLRATSFIVRF